MKYFLPFVFCFCSLFSAAKQVASLPPMKGEPAFKPLIYLDPGHGGADFGAVIKNPYFAEKRLCLTTAHYTKRHLEQMGYRVSLTRSRDFYLPLDKRVTLANRSGAGIFVAIHFNSCPNKNANGIEVYYTDSKNKRSVISQKLASHVLQKSVELTQAKSRGVKTANFYVTKQTAMPSILIESGFLTNAEEMEKIGKRDYLNKIAKGIAAGIDNFVRKNF